MMCFPCSRLSQRCQVERAFHMMETKEDGMIKPLIVFPA